ncbi:zinc finger MYM-type protein 1-like [Dorcoceras hygrometricum]|uniref:Zinc finger MYM-type protein 1-like n=1 Tax=Dorcoceras hygrometricum TaxID=472368 RepID=A0A2Z7CBS6_9LAMI|nr:zinc finger MYM-type protein 1-like [Dorcoceras hygrometricum]
MKYEFRLLNDILAKSITVKAGSFDAVTHERFLMMTAIHFGIKVNWSKILFEGLKEMVDRTIKRAKGFATQICVLLKGNPAVTLGEAKTFPPLKILSAKTVNTYVATNKIIDARGESDEPGVAKVAIVKKKSISKKKSSSIADKGADEVPEEVGAEKVVSKKRSAASSDAPVVKKTRTTTGKAASKKRVWDLYQQHQKPSALEEPILDQSTEIEKMMELETTAGIDDVDTIIDQILADTAQMETDAGVTDVEGHVEKRSDKTERMISVTADEFVALDFHVFTNEAEQRIETGSDTEDEMETAMKEESEPLSKISFPAVDTTDVTESLSQLRASITRLSVNKLKTSSRIGDLQNHLLFKIENLEKAFTEALTNQEQVHRNLIHSARQETQKQKAALSLEMLKYLREVRAQHDVMIIDLNDIRSQTREIQVLNKDFTDFQQKTETGIAHVSSQLSELIAYINRDGNDKKGELAAVVRSRLQMIEAEVVMVVVVVAEVSRQEKEEAVDLSREIGDIG